MAKSTTWNGLEWSLGVPVDGDTILGVGGAAPTGDDIPGSGLFAYSGSDVYHDPPWQIEDYIGPLSRINLIALFDDSNLAVHSNFRSAGMNTSAYDVLTVNGDCSATGDGVDLDHGGGLVLAAGVSFSSGPMIIGGYGGAVTLGAGSTLTITSFELAEDCLGFAVSGSGRIVVAGSMTLPKFSAPSVSLIVQSGTTQITGLINADMVLAMLHVSAGATLDGEGNVLSVANKVIQGGGTITNVAVPEGETYYTTCTIGSGCPNVRPYPIEELG
jgi:hypothetical protein